MTTVEDVLSRLSKGTAEKVRIGNDITKDRLPTASFGLNLTTGGLGIGKQHTFWGNEMSGKSALMLQTIAVNQRNGIVCGYIDAEKAFDYEWATRLGVDTSQLIVSQVSSIGHATDASIDLIKSGVSLLVVDSTSELMPGSFYEGDEIKNFENTRQMAQQARELGDMSRMIQGENFTAALCLISQQRVDVGASGMNKPSKPSGGKEIGHNDQLRIRLMSSKSESKAIMGNIEMENMILEEAVGRAVMWSVDKNKLNGHYGSGTYDLYFRGDEVGLDRTGELLDYATKYGIVVKGGAWYTVFGERFQGRAKAVEYVKENPELVEKIEAEVIAKSL